MDSFSNIPSNVGWIFPKKEKCGISIYSKNYVSYLNELTKINHIDPRLWISNRDQFIKKVNYNDIIHIQYETSFYQNGYKNFYLNLISSIKKPVIVSLHEIYETFPDAYPRDSLKGTGVLLKIKQIIYDFRHPLQTSFNKHIQKSFLSDHILVHHKYHKEILKRKGISPVKILVIELPVKTARSTRSHFSWNNQLPLRLGSTGFINPHYDYDLLFSVLETLNIDWTFTWIGGVRERTGNQILNQILEKVRLHKWEHKIKITGWVSEDEQDNLLSDLDIYLALFKHHSSSSSIAKALGACKFIVASSIPLCEEIASYGGPIITTVASPSAVKNSIYSIVNNEDVRYRLEQGILQYTAAFDYSSMADKMMNFYKKVLSE